jgi:phage baseplate assembly protein W
MPLERVSKSFKDVSLTFQANPLTFDLIALKNETAIARSIRNLVYTVPGERFFNQNIGSKISQSLFENIDSISALAIEGEIKNTIENYEPRVELVKIKVEPDFDSNQFDVTIIYNIIGIEALPQQLSFALLPTR